MHSCYAFAMIPTRPGLMPLMKNACIAGGNDIKHLNSRVHVIIRLIILCTCIIVIGLSACILSN